MTRIESSVRPTLAGARAVAAVRMALVLLAAGAVLAAMLLAGGGEPSSSHRYACPMHSEVTASSPGDCPICGMALEEVDATSRAALLRDPASAAGDQVGFAQLRVSYEATMLMRFAVAAVRRNAVPGEVFAPAIVAPDGEIVAQLYRDELASLAPDEVADWAPSASPAAVLEVRRDDTPPVIASPSDAVARVGFRATLRGPAPPPGQVGWVKLAYRSRAMLVVRSAAILPSPEGPYVLVFSNQRGGLARRRIEVGKDYAGMTAVVSGLRDKEFVVMANAFSVDAERRLQAAP
ncbi:MAG TPA: heavy metal-binding domain-containing protein [Kofleriaceae bacterium]|nr:heavy metal-binding domain-containing protein [Kofleriaceae bacterium]